MKYYNIHLMNQVKQMNKRFEPVFNGMMYIGVKDNQKDELLMTLECIDKMNDLNSENQRLKLENDGLRYALKYIKQIDVEIDIGDGE